VSKFKSREDWIQWHLPAIRMTSNGADVTRSFLEYSHDRAVDFMAKHPRGKDGRFKKRRRTAR